MKLLIDIANVVNKLEKLDDKPIIESECDWLLKDINSKIEQCKLRKENIKEGRTKEFLSYLENKDIEGARKYFGNYVLLALAEEGDWIIKILYTRDED
jgi:hypothetical protein